MSGKHTPGTKENLTLPWGLDEVIRRCEAFDDLLNARNELLEACKESLIGLEQLGDDSGWLGNMLRTAIAHAEANMEHTEHQHISVQDSQSCERCNPFHLRLSQYRAVLDEGMDPKVLSEVQSALGRAGNE